MHSKRSREGYLLVDHSASPGLPEHIALAAGYDPKFCGEGQTFEAATLKCSHCGNTVIKNPLRTRGRELCSKCDHFICDLCYMASQDPSYQHLPFEKVIDITINLAAKGLGSPRELLDSQPKLLIA